MTYIQLLNQIKQSTAAKKKYFFFKINKKNNQLLKKLVGLNIIKVAVVNPSNNIVKILLPNPFNTQFLKNIKILYRQSAPIFIKIKTLKNIKKYKYNSLYLILTNNGCLTNYEAIEQNTGGILLCKFLH